MLLVTYPILYGTKYADNPINPQQEQLAISITKHPFKLSVKPIKCLYNATNTEPMV